MLILLSFKGTGRDCRVKTARLEVKHATAQSKDKKRSKIRSLGRRSIGNVLNIHLRSLNCAMCVGKP
jgi:hypothetical protein